MIGFSAGCIQGTYGFLAGVVPYINALLGCVAASFSMVRRATTPSSSAATRSWVSFMKVVVCAACAFSSLMFLV